MSRKVHMTEAQLSEIKRRITEGGIEAFNATSQNFDNTTLQRQADIVRGIASANPSSNVTFNGVQVNPSHDSTSELVDTVKDNASSVVNSNGIQESCFRTTKRQIKEAKLKKLKESCIKYTKEDIENGL